MSSSKIEQQIDAIEDYIDNCILHLKVYKV